MQFASCQWNPYAKSFIQQMYPSITIEDDKIPLLIDLINRDVLRVQDPNFHSPCQIVAGTNYQDSLTTEVHEAIEEFKREVHNA
jgi:hypothetical protein